MIPCRQHRAGWTLALLHCLTLENMSLRQPRGSTRCGTVCSGIVYSVRIGPPQPKVTSKNCSRARLVVRVDATNARYTSCIWRDQPRRMLNQHAGGDFDALDVCVYQVSQTRCFDMV